MNKGTLQPRGFHMLLYGAPGILKTTLACQMPKPLLLLDIEHASGWLDDDVKAGIDVLVPDPSEGFTTGVSNELIKVARLDSYATVVIDSLTTLRMRELDAQAGGIMPAQGMYGLFNAWLGRILVQSQYFKQIIIWIAASEEQTDGQRKVIVPGGLSDNNLLLCTQVLDAVVYAGWKQKPGGNPSRFLTVAATEPFGGRSSILTKDRTNLLKANQTVDITERKPGEPLPNMAAEFFKPVIDRVLAQRKAPAPAPAVAAPVAGKVSAAPSTTAVHPATPVSKR